MIINVTDIIMSRVMCLFIILYMFSIVIRAILWGDSWYERY